MRPRDSRMPVWAGHGVAPPINPVLPPCGTIAMPWAWQSFTIFETSSVVAGRTTAAACPASEPRQSVTKGCLSRSSRIRPLSPTISRKASRMAGVTGAVGMEGFEERAAPGIWFSLRRTSNSVLRLRARRPSLSFSVVLDCGSPVLNMVPSLKHALPLEAVGWGDGDRLICSADAGAASLNFDFEANLYDLGGRNSEIRRREVGVEMHGGEQRFSPHRHACHLVGR